MFDLTVRVDVTLPSGAHILLEEKHQKRITNFVKEVVLGKEDLPIRELLPPVEKRGRRKLRGPRGRDWKWTAEQKEALRVIASRYVDLQPHEHNEERNLELDKFRVNVVPKRTKSAVAAMYNSLLIKEKKNRKSASLHFTGYGRTI